MSGILTIVQNTPLWVFALFAILMWVGLQALRPRTLPIWRLLVTPAIFIVWGVTSLAEQSLTTPIVIADWSTALALAAAIAWTMTRLDNVSVDRKLQTVALPASAIPLIRNGLIFAAKYALGVAVAMMPAWRSEITLWDLAISGASAGYFLGWLARFAMAYRQTKPSLTDQVLLSRTLHR